MLCKCDDEEREFPSIQRGVGWCEAQAKEFLLTPEQSYQNLSKRAVGKNGQPPLWVRVASFLMQFEWYRGSLRFRLKMRRGCFFVF